MANETMSSSSHVVVVVESDVLVRMPIAGYLRECGFKVVEAVNGAEAMTVLQDAELPVEVVLTDAALVGEPNGFALATWMRDNHPQIHVILAANTASAAAQAGKLCDEHPSVTKPYDHQLVETRIRQLIAARDRFKLLHPPGIPKPPLS